MEAPIIHLLYFDKKEKEKQRDDDHESGRWLTLEEEVGGEVMIKKGLVAASGSWSVVTRMFVL